MPSIKYTSHVSGLEARDARDRRIPHEKEREFTRKHPVLSKIIQAQHDKVFSDNGTTSHGPRDRSHEVMTVAETLWQ